MAWVTSFVELWASGRTKGHVHYVRQEGERNSPAHATRFATYDDASAAADELRRQLLILCSTRTAWRFELVE